MVEPFTGEGIYYALASGELAADAIISQHNGRDEAEVAAAYSRSACQTLSRAALDQSARASRGVVSARRLGLSGSGAIPTGAASASDGEDRAVINAVCTGSFKERRFTNRLFDWFGGL